jgi:hypothetical protein
MLFRQHSDGMRAGTHLNDGQRAQRSTKHWVVTHVAGYTESQDHQGGKFIDLVECIQKAVLNKPYHILKLHEAAQESSGDPVSVHRQTRLESP